MAEIKSFPNNQDEYIGAEDVMRWHHGRTSGVFGAEGNATVSAVPGRMAVTVSDGNGWLANDKGNGIVWWIDDEAETGEKLELSVSTGHAALPRVDRVVVAWQTTNYVARPEVFIAQGTPASSPVAPELTNDNMVREISLARITVPAGATKIEDYMITDERTNPNVCGIVTELVGVDTAGMHQQFQSFYVKTVAEQNAYIESQKNSWEAFFSDVQQDTVVPVPTLEDQGKVMKVNPTGDGYMLGDAQMQIPITDEVPEESDIWIDPTETAPGLIDYVVAVGNDGNGLQYRKWEYGDAELFGAFHLSKETTDARLLETTVTLPFAIYDPIVTMTIKNAKNSYATQGKITLTYTVWNNTQIRLSMIKDEGNLTDDDVAIVAVNIKGPWKQ